MQVRFFKALWGMESLPVVEAIEKIVGAGYDGFETPLAAVVEARNAGIEAPAIAMLFVETVDALREGLDLCGKAGVEAVNVHAGKHAFSFQEGCRFFEGALEAVRDSGIGVTFETHRGRLLYEPQSTAAYLRHFPHLRLTADFSHWTCVCESMLADQDEAVELAVQAASLIHARVGHEEGPQVPDPRAPRWEGHVAAFEAFWDRIRAAHEARDEPVLRVNPEFGPPNYMWTSPSDGRPLADLWDVCLWMRDRLAARWARPERGE